MRFNIFSTIALAVTLSSLAVAAPTNPTTTTTLLTTRDANANTTDTLVTRDDTVAIIGTWDDYQCHNGKVDDSIAAPQPNHYSNCKELRGNSMEVFWLKKGCTILLFPSRGCDFNPVNWMDFASGWNQCFDVAGYVSWMGYCK